MKKLPALLFATATFLAAPLSSLHAQSQAAQQELATAYDLLSSADYKGAAAAYEGVISGYPTDISVQTAQIQLAICRFYLGEFDKALTSLDKTKSGPLGAEQAAVVDNLRPQILAAKGMSLPPSDSGRKGILEQAIKSYSDFITKYPTSPELESAIYGRALCAYQVQDFPKAVTDLRENIQKFPASATIDGSKNLLAITLATQGGDEITRSGGDKTKGLDLLKQAQDILREIIDGKKDLALVNDAQFQTGEILFMRAAFSPEGERQPLYNQAADAYMAVSPKESIVAQQQEKVASFAARKKNALLARNLPLKAQLDKENERELKKLAEISAKPDQTAQAVLKLGEIFFNAGRTNESRVVIDHITPFLAADDDKMRALYFKTCGYAVQGAAEPAVQNYDQFQAAYSGKPLAENLPFLIGNMLLSQGRAADSLRYFDDSLRLYPQGRFASLSVAQKAQAQLGLKQYADALTTFQGTLQKNPTPEVAVIAQFGIANIHRDTAKWDEAIQAYKATVDKFPGTPQAAESAYWIAACTQQKGDQAGSIPLLQAFIQSNADSPLLPLATFALGNAQIATGQKDAGLATLAEVAERFPDSPPAPFTFFARAQVHAAAQNVEAINTLMRDFIAKYPTDDKVYFAFNSIAQNQTNAQDIDGAIATWSEFASKYPQNPNSAGAYVKIAELNRTAAERLATNYTSLNEADRAQWKSRLDASMAALQTLLDQYPQSPDVVPGLQSLLANERLLVRSGLKDNAAVESSLQGLADKSTDSAAKSKILFAQAAFIADTDKPRALSKMAEAFDTTVVYSPKDLEIYGLALVEGRETDKALVVFDKLAADYPLATPPTALQQEAQATALFGKGRVAQQKGDTATAGRLFQQLKTDYPWSPKGLEADYGIAQAERASGKLDDAMQKLGGIIRAQNATAELRANSFLLYGHIMKDKTAAESDPKKKDENRASAIDFFMKIPQFYSGVPAAAAEGLWEGGLLLEQQAAASTDPKFKTQQLDRAKAAFRQIVKDFPGDKLAAQAKQKLASLGGDDDDDD